MAKQSARLTSVDIDELQLLETETPSFSNLEGSIDAGQNSSQRGGDKQRGGGDLGTLDEPVTETLKRDLTAVMYKFSHVFYPRQSQSLLRDWDLWGPLVLCVTTALLLQERHSHGPAFTESFVITFFGACVVTINMKLLGGTISFFQSLCVMGYCLLPCTIALIVCKIILLSSSQSMVLFIIRLLVTILGLSWATFASTAFLTGSISPPRKALAVYPVFLFYFVVSWLIISQTHYGH